MTLKPDLTDDDDGASVTIDLDKPFLGVAVSTSVKSARGGTYNNPLPAPAKHAAPPLPNNIYSTATALKLAALLSEYEKQVVRDAAQLRTYVTNKLIEISGSGNPRDELRALELLGKVSDVGLFVEKSEIKITHTATAELEDSLRGKIERLLRAKMFPEASPSDPIEDGVVLDFAPESADDEEYVDDEDNE